MSHNRLFQMCAVVVFALVLASAFNVFGVVNARTNASPIEPNAGAWKTWVLTSGGQLRRPAPPDRAATEKELKELDALVAKRDVAALDQIAFWNTGAPSYRWNELAVNESLKAGQPGGPGTRALALVNAAMYDATIAAYDSKYAFNRLRPNEINPALTTVIPNPQTPSYPSEHAAVAGAASTVLAYLFPDNAKNYTEQAEAAAKSRLLAGVEYPSDVAVGLELGRAVGALVVERAKKDGFDAKWTGTVPTTAGSWTGTNPAGVTTGTWKTWVLKSGSELRPPAPFAYNSAEQKKEMAELKTLQRTPKQTADAFFNEYGAGSLRGASIWNRETSKKLFESGLMANGPRAARAYALVSAALYDATVACFEAKYAYWAIRPFQLDPEFKPLFPTPNHPSYPAAHGCANSAPAAVLAYLFPRDAQELNAIADAAGESRIWAGIHFRNDIVAGLKLGRDVAQKVIEYAQKDGSQPALVGTFKIPDSPYGTKSITLEANGRYSIRPFDIQGTYQIEGDQITFIEDAGDDRRCTGIAGKWKWKFDGKVLTLNLVQDGCWARRDDYGQGSESLPLEEQ